MPGMSAPTDQLPPAPHPRRRRSPNVETLRIAAVAAIVAAVATVGAFAFVKLRGHDQTAAGPAGGTLTVAGFVELERGQFVWSSDRSCAGLQGFDDVRAGAQVAVTDAAGKALAIGTLDQGVANGITTESDGMARATTCTLAFKLADVPRGAGGPYGVEVAHRGVVRYDEGHLGIIRMTF